MDTQQPTQLIYYWQSGAWIDDEETANMAVELLGFPNYEKIELPETSNIDEEINKLIKV